MGEVIEFPSSRIRRQWSEQEEDIRAVLMGKGMPSEAIKSICASMKTQFEGLAKFTYFKGQIHLPGDLTPEQARQSVDSIQEYNSEVEGCFKALYNQAILCILRLEVELWRSREEKK